MAQRKFKPTNREERRVYRDSCIASYEKELQELQDMAPNVGGFFYSDHLGVWILQFKDGEDQEFDTKDEMIQFIKDDVNGA
jgi:hypothetical protein